MYLSQKSYQSLPTDETPLSNTTIITDGVELGALSPSQTPSWFTNITKSTRSMVFLGAWCGTLMLFAISPQEMDLLRSRSLTANTIKICVKETVLVTERPSVGAHVTCVDKDFDADDFMGSAITGPDGCATFTYTNQWWDAFFLGTQPDIVCTAHKPDFVDYTAKMRSHHDQNELAYFDGVLFRDRMAEEDYGEVNKCGPTYTSGIVNDSLSTYVLGFTDQCNNHDKCYYDCKILDAFSNDYRRAHNFCDNEFKEEMYSLCNLNHGDYVDVGDDACKGVAHILYSAVNSEAVLQYYTEGLSGDQIHSCDTTSTQTENTSIYGSAGETNFYG